MCHLSAVVCNSCIVAKLCAVEWWRILICCH